MVGLKELVAGPDHYMDLASERSSRLGPFSISDCDNEIEQSTRSENPIE